MAEGRRDRSGRRRRRSAAHQERNDRYRASSDGEVAPCEAAGIGRPPCHFHEGLDVDQLARYRRRQVKDKPRDHLGCLKKDAAVNDDEEEEEEDEFERQKRLVTEYRLAFRASSDDIFHDSKDLLSPIRRKRHVDDNSSDKNKIDENLRASDHVPLNNKNSNTLNNKSEIEKDSGKIMEMGTDALKRPAPIRRGTTLRCEGDFNADTEYTNYVPFLGLHRSELRRRGTSLRMEGDFAGNTEKNDKFIEWPVESCRRPEPIRLPSHLRLEGDLQTSTESHDKYVPFIGARRPEILKQSAQLKLEGDSNWTAEYADVFQKYDFVDRRAPKIPESSLKPGGGFYDKTETKDLFTNPRDKETELMAELAKDAEEEEEKKKKEEEEEKNRLKKEEEMRLLVSKLEDLKSPVLEIPEYKDAYKDFPRERPRLMKPEDEIGLSDGSKAPASPSHSRFKTKIDQDPEYKSIYLDPNRSIYHKPPHSFRPSASSSRNSLYNNNYYYRRDSKKSDPPLSEIRSQYVNYGQVSRMENLRMPTSLRLEGDMDMEPEYRNAYCADEQKRGSILNESSSMRPRERSLSASRRRESNNYWINNDNGDHFGTINAADEQDAFQVLQTRVHEESVVGKPPLAARRNSRSSIARSSIQQPDITLTADRSLPLQQSQHHRNRSPSPSYRLQVSHVDDEPRGFLTTRHQRRSPIQNLNIHPTNERASPSPIQQTLERPYSPSFARENSAITRHQQQQHAFTVLDNNNDDLLEGPPRRRRTDRNYNPRDSLSSIRTSNGNIPRMRNRTPPKWMPPWYDSSTSTI